MERGFYHPDRGYWQTVGSDPYTTSLRTNLIPQGEGKDPIKSKVTIFDDYPAGTVEVPLKPGSDYEWIDDKWVHVPPSVEDTRARMTPLTARQFRLGLVGAGKALSDVDAAIEALPEGPEKEAAQVEWLYATAFKRTHPLVLSLSEALGFTQGEVDDLWGQALSL